MHLLFAIHNIHYVVEQIIREKTRDTTFRGALHKIGFEKILKKVNEKKTIPEYSRLLELNNIRNNAEHYFIIPDANDVRFYIRIVGDFLKWSYKEYFGVDYESLAFENRIYDVPIRNAMIEAKALIEKNELLEASKKMYEALGAFKFLWFAYLSDPRLKAITVGETDLSSLLADLAFKIVLAEDEPALRKMSRIRTEFTETADEKRFGLKSVFPSPIFKDKESAKRHYEDILGIILTYQDKAPSSTWRAS